MREQWHKWIQLRSEQMTVGEMEQFTGTEEFNQAVCSFTGYKDKESLRQMGVIEKREAQERWDQVLSSLWPENSDELDEKQHRRIYAAAETAMIRTGYRPPRYTSYKECAKCGFVPAPERETGDKVHWCAWCLNGWRKSDG